MARGRGGEAIVDDPLVGPMLVDQFKLKVAEVRGLVVKHASDLSGARRNSGNRAVARLALIAALKDRNAQVRLCAAGALGEIGPESKEAIPALSQALKDKDPKVRDQAAKALTKFGAEGKDAVPALAAALSDPNAAVRIEAAYALAAVGPEANSAIPALNKMLKEKDGGVRGAAKYALRKIQARE